MRWGSGSITAVVQKSEFEEAFTREAEEKGMVQLSGHPAFGGIRVTLYNHISEESFEAIVDFMEEFMARRVR